MRTPLVWPVATAMSTIVASIERARRRAVAIRQEGSGDLAVGDGAFVGEAADGDDALFERRFEAAAPAARGEGGRVLVGLLVRLGVEMHAALLGRGVLANRDQEFDVALGLPPGDGEVVQADELFRRFGPGKFPAHRAALGQRDQFVGSLKLARASSSEPYVSNSVSSRVVRMTSRTKGVGPASFNAPPLFFTVVRQATSSPSP